MHMIECRLSPIALVAYARERGLSARELAADPAYAVHCWLAEALGAQAVRPFYITQVAPTIRVLGYSAEPACELTARMAFNAAPSVAQVLEGVLQSKQMPDAFAPESVFQFELKLLATRKSGQGEKDAFLVECDRQGADATVDRYAVYVALLQERLAGAAKLLSANVVSFDLAPVVRKQQKAGGAREVTLARVPQVQLRGTLQVEDAQAFAQLLGQGVGRGSGLGFGMLRLRRL